MNENVRHKDIIFIQTDRNVMSECFFHIDGTGGGTRKKKKPWKKGKQFKKRRMHIPLPSPPTIKWDGETKKVVKNK